MHILLVSTYELGRQPFGLASPAAWLREAGHTVTCADLSRQPLSDEEVRQADLVGFYLPMHTATRLAVAAVEQVRAWNPRAHLCGFGLYAPLNAAFLRAHGVQTILGGEFEDALTKLAARLAASRAGSAAVDLSDGSGQQVPRLRFRVPDRRGLPALTRYAALETGDGRRRVVGYTEASRGCKHLCRHCPVVPVYNGRFRVVPPDVVLADIRAQVEQGAEHITFGDPDFFNGVGHALEVVDSLARAFPGLTYDVTIKIEHLLQHAAHVPRLRETGCLFVTSAVESIDDRVLALLQKGHTRGDFLRAVALCRQAGLWLMPTFVAFTPWITVDGYCELLQAIDELDLVDQVPSIQLVIRLLIPQGSRLLELEQVRSITGSFNPSSLTYPWRHPDGRVDDLQRELAAIVAARAGEARREVFEQVYQVARRRAGRPDARPERAIAARATVPYLTEPWYC